MKLQHADRSSRLVEVAVDVFRTRGENWHALNESNYCERNSGRNSRTLIPQFRVCNWSAGTDRRGLALVLETKPKTLKTFA